MKRRLARQPLCDYRYRDFGSLVSLGELSTVGNMMCRLIGGNAFIEDLFVRMMYLSLHKMHEFALRGFPRVALDTLARMITRRTEPLSNCIERAPQSARPRSTTGLRATQRN